jgi:hypothetical protein
MGITSRRDRPRPAMECELDVVTSRSADTLPSPDDHAAMDHFARAISLHVARAHAAVEMAKRRLLAGAHGEDIVTRDMPIASAIGPDLDVVRVANALEKLDILTVGELLDCIRDAPARLLGLDGLGLLGVVNITAAILRHAI